MGRERIFIFGSRFTRVLYPADGYNLIAVAAGGNHLLGSITCPGGLAAILYRPYHRSIPSRYRTVTGSGRKEHQCYLWALTQQAVSEESVAATHGRVALFCPRKLDAGQRNSTGQSVGLSFFSVDASQAGGLATAAHRTVW